MHLSFLTGTDLDKYLNDMKICQTYAQKNRLEIANTILRNLGNTRIVDTFETVHNYIDFDDRKYLEKKRCKKRSCFSQRSSSEINNF